MRGCRVVSDSVTETKPSANKNTVSIGFAVSAEQSL